jgi:hypothetical protein
VHLPRGGRRWRRRRLGLELRRWRRRGGALTSALSGGSNAGARRRAVKGGGGGPKRRGEVEKRRWFGAGGGVLRRRRLWWWAADRMVIPACSARCANEREGIEEVASFLVPARRPAGLNRMRDAGGTDVVWRVASSRRTADA